MGNCDNRAAFASVFPDAAQDAHGFVQSVVTLGGTALFCLDSLDREPDPKHSGVLCADRLGWLDAQLAACAASHRVVVAHHPPAAVGMAGPDRLRLRNGDALLDLLRAHGVDLLICGHLHRPILATLKGQSTAILGSTAFDVALATNSDAITPIFDVPPLYHVLLDTDAGPVLHCEQVPMA
ncbi:metallophosphoesterase [Cognatishimia sp. F0-27]|nr:metallophosphoesterase [Cognatishimia sp. F0-27]MCC1492515.1 metallophosphoesterase [Cognatishimia sp. F0-27]